MNKRMYRLQAPAVGGSSLLVIFAVLCLTVFSLLSLSTVQADLRLSDASASAVSAYYEADYQAEEILAALRAGEWPDGVSVDGDVYSYSCPVSETQELQVEVRFAGAKWTILRWQEVSTVEKNTEETLSLWDGDVMF